jgi:hypothetical protein
MLLEFGEHLSPKLFGMWGSDELAPIQVSPKAKKAHSITLPSTLAQLGHLADGATSTIDDKDPNSTHQSPETPLIP